MLVLTIAVNLVSWALIILYLHRRFQRFEEEKTGLGPIREEVSQLILELDQTTERNIQLMENRIAELKTLNTDAVRQISLLEQQKEDYSRALDRYRELGRLENPLRKAEPQPAEEPKEESLSPKERVLPLYRDGSSLEEIAAETGIPQGEVELIITMSHMRK